MMNTLETSKTPAPPPPLPPPATTNGNGQGSAPAKHEHAEDEIPHDLHRPHPVLLIAVLLGFAAAGAGLFFTGWVPHEQQNRQAEADAKEMSSLVPTVNVTAPTKQPASHELSLPCDIRPNQETLIYPQATGYLKKLNVDIQDPVKKGDVLAVIDAPEVDAELEQSKAAATQARANVTKAQSDLDLAQRTVDRYQDISSGSVSKQEKDEKGAARDQAAAALEQAKANVTAADANVQRLTVEQGFEKVTAPFDGTITERNFDLGALLTTGNMTEKPLFRLTQATTLRVFISVPQVEASQIDVGQGATLTVRNFPGKKFEGTVARIAGAIDTSTRTMPFELHFANPKNELFAGMYGEVRLTISDKTPAILVPTSALVFNAGGTQVALVKNGKVHFEKVAVGQDMGTQLEITSGINSGDHVIVNPSERLVEGGDVNAIGEKTAEGTPDAAPKPAATQTADR